MRRLLFFLTFACALLSAQSSVTVTGNVGSVIVANPTDQLEIDFALVNCGKWAPTVAGKHITQQVVQVYPDATGAYSVTLYANNQIACGPTSPTEYKVTFIDNGSVVSTQTYILSTADSQPINLASHSVAVTPPIIPAQGGDANYVRRDFTNGPFTVPLPTRTTDPVNKQYVDALSFNGASTTLANTFTAAQNLSAGGNLSGTFTGNPTFGGTLTFNGANTFTQPQTFSGDHFDKGPTYDVRAFGAKCDGVTDDTTAIQAAVNAAVPLYPAIPPITFPAGTCLFDTVTYSSSNVLFLGRGAFVTILKHKDGSANPLFHNTAIATGAPPPAYPSGGFVGMTFQGGTLTTALIYVDGQIDSHMKFDDLRFQGTGGNSTMDAISVKDFLNWGLHRVRWDGIGGWGINVRGNSLVFNSGHLIVDDFSYDNSTGTTAWGNGLFTMDAATGTPLSSYKGSILFSNGRIEINRPLNGAAPSRGIVRILQDLTTWTSAGAGAPLIQVGFKNVAIDANGADNSIAQGRDMKVVSVSAGEVALSLEDFNVFQMTEILGNDAGTQKWTLPISWLAQMRIPSARTPGHTSSGSGLMYENHYGLSHYWAETDSTLNSAKQVRRGDVVWYRDPLNDSGHHGRPFAYKSTQSGSGYFDVAGATLGQTGSITTGTNTLQLSAAPSSGTVTEGTNITIVGAGAAAADLTAVITAVNFSTNVVTLDTNASTTVSGATLKRTAAQLFAVDMVQYGTAAPVSGTYQQGDKVLNLTPAANGILMWVNTVSGTPGTWVAVPTGDTTGKLTNAQLSTPPIPASLTTTAATTDNVTVTGMTSSGHCSLTPTNTSAATNTATTFISAKTTNQITVTHTATASMTYDVLCTPN